jgi:hypothetical protein
MFFFCKIRFIFIFQGLPDINYTVIQTKSKGKGKEGGDEFELVSTGTNLLGVMGIPGVDGTRTTTNHILEVCFFLLKIFFIFDILCFFFRHVTHLGSRQHATR